MVQVIDFMEFRCMRWLVQSYNIILLDEINSTQTLDGEEFEFLQISSRRLVKGSQLNHQTQRNSNNNDYFVPLNIWVGLNRITLIKLYFYMLKCKSDFESCCQLVTNTLSFKTNIILVK